jgi:hypothetical protein
MLWLNKTKTQSVIYKNYKGSFLFTHALVSTLFCLLVLNFVRNHVKLGVSLRVLYCVVDTGFGLGRSLGDCRPALPKSQKYQMVKTQTVSHVRRTVVGTNRWQIFFFSFEVRWVTAGIYHPGLWGFPEAL